MTGSRGSLTDRSVGAIAAVAALLPLLLAWGCQGESQSREYVFEGPTMGTEFLVKVVGEDLPNERLTGVRDAIARELENVNAKMSTYLESSELSRFNRRQAPGPFVISPETLQVFAASREISELTRGAFDITVGPLVNAWGFGPAARGETPTEDEIARLQATVGWRNIELDAATSSIRKLDPRTYCDLSAIAKGYAVDCVGETLQQMGHVQYMVEVGGEVRTGGRNASGQPWRIGVERPMEQGRAIERVLLLEDMALATSGDYRNFYEEDGQRLSHTIDPRTGHPVRHRLASVTVVDESCMRADGFATAMMVLGEEEGYDLAEKLDLAALFLVRDANGGFIEKATSRFRALFEDQSRDETEAGAKTDPTTEDRYR